MADRAGTAASATMHVASGLTAVSAVTLRIPLPHAKIVSAGAASLAAHFASASVVFGSLTTAAHLVAGQPLAVAIEKGVDVSVAALFNKAGPVAQEIVSDMVSNDLTAMLPRCEP